MFLLLRLWRIIYFGLCLAHGTDAGILCLSRRVIELSGETLAKPMYPTAIQTFEAKSFFRKSCDLFKRLGNRIPSGFQLKNRRKGARKRDIHVLEQ